MDCLYDGRQLIVRRGSAGADAPAGPAHREYRDGAGAGQRQKGIVIRNAQAQVLAAAPRRAFEQRAADHLARFFPHLPEGAVGRLLLARARRGIQEASLYGIESERDLLRWLNVAAALGEDFAQNPKYPWAARILASPLSPSSRVERLSQTALDVVHDLALKETLPPEPLPESGGEPGDDQSPWQDEELEVEP
jgi:hypothetical protein